MTHEEIHYMHRSDDTKHERKKLVRKRKCT